MVKQTVFPAVLRLVWIIGLWLAAPAAHAGQSDFWFTAELDAYRAVVEDYRAQSVEEVIDRVRAFEPRAVHELIDRVRGPDIRLTGTDAEPALNERLFRSAAMLHIDIAERLWWRGLESAATDQIEVAVRWADLSARRPEPPGSFRRRWYLAVTLLAFERGGWQAGLAFAELACDALPDDVPVLTAAAWMNEELALTPFNVGVSGESGLRRRQEAQRTLLEAAAGLARRALAVAPLAGEAALRRARVELLLGRVDDARERLQGLIGRPDLSRPHAYLARLLLGRMHARANDPENAERLLREASALLPEGQAARVALSRLLDTLGDRRAAAVVLEPVLRAEVPGGAADPWVAYRLGRNPGPALREALRGEVRQ